MAEQIEEEISCLLRVGYALPARKVSSFMVPKFTTYAKQKGIHFIAIDSSTPLTDQGPFDVIIHKLYGHQWNHDLQNFAVNHRNATVIDPPSAIQPLHNRISMLQSISKLNIPKLNTPNQLLIQNHVALSSPLTLQDLTFPVIVKPPLANGSSTSHDMSLVFNTEALTEGFDLDLEPPVVLQQFVNHGGVMFKVYVAGEYVKCVKRSSLPDVTEEMGRECGGVMKFSQVSGGGGGGLVQAVAVEMPAAEFVVAVAEGLRVELGLSLFNFDMIRDEKRDKYLVVDINYFPGYEKLPGFEIVMTEFFLNIRESQQKKKMMMNKVDESEVILKE